MRPTALAFAAGILLGSVLGMLLPLELWGLAAAVWEWLK